MSLRARLLAAALTLVALGLAVADVATYRSLRSFLYDRVDAQLVGAADNVERALARGPVRSDATLRTLGDLVPGVYVQVRDADGTVLLTVAGRARTAPPRLVPSTGAQPAGFHTVGSAVPDGPRYRTRVSALQRGSAQLVVALPLDDTDTTLRRLLWIETLVTVGVLVAVAAAGLWLVRLGLRPLADIEATAGAITGGELRTRVANADPRTEVGRVGGAQNVMLDRIDEAFTERRESEEAARASEQRMRRFVADASHELRTPVAAMRAYAELYRRGADQHPEDLARLLSRIETESARIGGLVDDLLLLTRLDEGRPLAREVGDLGAVAADAVEAARTLEPDREISLEVDGSVEVLGDRDRLRQVVDNLLANVRTHTAAGSPAGVLVFADAEAAVLEVADRGPGVGEAGQWIFERFYRADTARTRDQGGAGLGLSIVAAITGAHGGSVTTEDPSTGGAIFRITLPVFAEQAGGSEVQ